MNQRRPRLHLPQLSTSSKWLIVCVIVMVAFIVAVWPRENSSTADKPLRPTITANANATDSQLRQARVAAQLPWCPQLPSPHAGNAPLAGVSATCLGTGKTVDMGAITGGKPVLLNFWASWCPPCRSELPIIADFARSQTGQRVHVLLVQREDYPLGGLDTLTQLNVKLPTVTDPHGQIAAKLGVPNVYPASVLLHGDGTVAAVLPRVFESVQQIDAQVTRSVGVR